MLYFFLLQTTWQQMHPQRKEHSIWRLFDWSSTVVSNKTDNEGIEFGGCTWTIQSTCHRNVSVDPILYFEASGPISSALAQVLHILDTPSLTLCLTQMAVCDFISARVSFSHMFSTKYVFHAFSGVPV